MEKSLERIAALEGAMQEVHGKQQAAEERAAAMQSQWDAAERRLNRWRGLAAVLALLVVVGLSPQASQAQLTLEQRVAALEAKLKFLTTAGTTITISGANLVINNGKGSTATTNGLGNLIIGYNELRPLNPNGTNPNLRTGSHNLELGSRNNFSSYGGIVAGDTNSIRAAFASVAGGSGNAASGLAAMVSGGQGNLASGNFASVSGGYFNTANWKFASVSGGDYNIASGAASSVSGGGSNEARGDEASVSGGYLNFAGGLSAAVLGGQQNDATGEVAAVSGGQQNAADGFGASVSGGGGNFAGGDYASVSGGANITQPKFIGWSAGGNGGFGFFHVP